LDVDDLQKLPVEGGNGHHHDLPGFESPRRYFLKVELVEDYEERARVFQKWAELTGHHQGALLKVPLMIFSIPKCRFHGIVSVFVQIDVCELHLCYFVLNIVFVVVAVTALPYSAIFSAF